MASAQDRDGDFALTARTSLARLGVEADEVQLAIMEAADAIWGARSRALLAADLAAVPYELDEDVSRPPRP
jgi:hypothetical protein